jgi:hypothetical protein
LYNKISFTYKRKITHTLKIIRSSKCFIFINKNFLEVIKKVLGGLKVRYNL